MHRTQGLPLHDVKTAPSVAFYFILQLTACADINTAEEAKTYYRRLFFLLHEEVRTIQHLHFMAIAGNMLGENTLCRIYLGP